MFSDIFRPTLENNLVREDFAVKISPLSQVFSEVTRPGGLVLDSSGKYMLALKASTKMAGTLIPNLRLGLKLILPADRQEVRAYDLGLIAVNSHPNLAGIFGLLSPNNVFQLFVADRWESNPFFLKRSLPSDQAFGSLFFHPNGQHVGFMNERTLMIFDMKIDLQNARGYAKYGKFDATQPVLEVDLFSELPSDLPLKVANVSKCGTYLFAMVSTIDDDAGILRIFPWSDLGTTNFKAIRTGAPASEDMVFDPYMRWVALEATNEVLFFKAQPPFTQVGRIPCSFSNFTNLCTSGDGSLIGLTMDLPAALEHGAFSLLYVYCATTFRHFFSVPVAARLTNLAFHPFRKLIYFSTGDPLIQVASEKNEAEGGKRMCPVFEDSIYEIDLECDGDTFSSRKLFQ